MSGPITAFLGRILLGAIFLISGSGKIADPAAVIAVIESKHLPFPQLAVAIAIAISVEIGCAAALVAGYRTRTVAAILAAYCFVTAVVFHSVWGDHNQFLHFWKNLAMAGGLLQVVSFGPSRPAFDAKRA
jgi:putative oxidoreductase